MTGTKIMRGAIIVVAAVALSVVSYAMGASGIGIGSTNYNTGYAAGMTAAQRKLQDSGLIPRSPAKVMTISGTVKSVGTDRFVINANRLSINPLDSQGPAESTIVVNDKTQITARIPASSKDFAAAMKVFQDNMKAGKRGTPPAPFTDKAATLADIKISMMVTVTAAENIKDAATVNATQILFQAVPSATQPVPPATR
jgi:hypothetical protein